MSQAHGTTKSVRILTNPTSFRPLVILLMPLPSIELVRCQATIQHTLQLYTLSHLFESIEINFLLSPRTENKSPLAKNPTSLLREFSVDSFGLWHTYLGILNI